jgi:hypothetical protein
MSGVLGFIKYRGWFWVIICTELDPASDQKAGSRIELADEIDNSWTGERRPASLD